MTLQEVVAALGLGEYEEQFAPGWEEAERERPAELFFLDPDYVREACRECYVPEEVTESAVRAARRMAANEALSALAWYMHTGLYRTQAAEWDGIGEWPDRVTALGEEAGRFYLVVLLSGLPGMQAEHRAHDIPAEVVRDTLSDIPLWLGIQRKRGGGGLPDFVPVNAAWLSNHFRARIYRLGRLQFQFGTFWGKLRVYRHRLSRAVLALCESGARYTREGQLDRRGSASETWEARLEVTEEAVTGSPMLPTGRAVRKEVRLPLTEWEPVLAPGDASVNLHIPGGEPLTHAACGESFRKAMAFFSRHYPDYHYRAFCCGSWILNSWLEEVLPPDSNLVRFQRELYLFSIGVWVSAMYNRVFGREELPADPGELPRDTQLQRAIAEALESGRGVGSGAGGALLFPEDFAWGSEVYRRQRPPVQ